MPSALAVFRLMAGPIRLDASVGVISGHGGSTVQDAQTGSSWSSGASSTYWRGRNTRSRCSSSLQWLDAATLDKAIEVEVNFYAAHLKAWA